MSFEATSGPSVRPQPFRLSRVCGASRWSALGKLVKRGLDVVIASTALLILAPLQLVVAPAIGCSGGPVFYGHRRVGRNGKAFLCYKFRTMRPGSDALLAAHLAANPDAAEEWRATRKLRRDPRVTRLGRLLRETSLDELPQVFNVLRGDMSCVGPRPIVFSELQSYGAVARDYFTVRPGLTGLWQVSGRSSVSYEVRVELDRHYVRNRSILFDLMILARTVPAVVRRSQTS